MFKLLRKIWFTLVGNANDSFEKSHNPSVTMRQVKRDMAEQRKRLRRAWVELETQRILALPRQQDLTTLVNNLRAQAETAKKNEDLDNLQRLATEYVSTEKMKNSMDAQIASIDKRMETISKEIESINFKESQLEMESEMAKSTMIMHDIEKSSSNNSVGDNTAQEMLELSRKRLEEVEAESTAMRNASSTLDGKNDTTSRDAKSFIDSL